MNNMDFIKNQIKSIIKYVLAGGIISLVIILICLLFGNDYSVILSYIAVFILLIAVFGIVGTMFGGSSGRSINPTTLKPYEKDNTLNMNRTSSSIFRALKLFLTAYIVFFISRI